jgi:hypothetical protein
VVNHNSGDKISMLRIFATKNLWLYYRIILTPIKVPISAILPEINPAKAPYVR